jgi:hypothetical protein
MRYHWPQNCTLGMKAETFETDDVLTPLDPLVIEQSLKSVAGVADAHSNLASGMVTITYDPDKLTGGLARGRERLRFRLPRPGAPYPSLPS